MTKASIASLIENEPLLKEDRSPMPGFIEPMQATRINEPFNDADFIYEVKWDGYRIIAKVEKGKVQLFSRKGLDYTRNYPPIAEALSGLKYNCILDGELVVLNKEGKPDFDALQRYRKGDTIVYYVFDLLWLEGYSLMKLSLLHRRRMLEKILSGNQLVKLSASFDDGIALYNQVKGMDLEGIVAKQKNSSYKSGKRVNSWLKIPTEIRQEFVIGGWTESSSGRSFKSLLFGYYDEGKLIYAGHAGGGYKDKEMAGILARLKKLEIKKSPFANEVETDATTHWIKPELVAEIKYATLTAGGKIRKPAIFLGFREDKPATEVVKEIPEIPDEGKSEKSKPISKKNSLTNKAVKSKTVKTTDPESNWPEIEKRKITSKSVFEFAGKEVELTNIEKVLWGDITKTHLLMYYHAVCPYILPHLKDRPLSLYLKPDGPHAPGFYIKDMEGRQPEWAEVFTVNRKHKKKGRRDQIDYLVCQDEATLQYIINLGCIDVNPWTSRISTPEEPDYIIIDLDPSDDDFSKAIDTALAAKEFFDEHKLIAFPKTSGKTGIHIYLPCEGFSFTQARTIAEQICDGIHHLVPGISTTSVSINSRGNKLYLDPNQNDYADTVAAPYSMRPYKVPGISTPLEWREVRKGLDPSSFTIDTVLTRLKKKGDLFKGALLEKNRVANAKKLLKFM
jgi:bifunctional non-homologous end joining protein LigD